MTDSPRYAPAPDSGLEVHVLTHTHWDREWYSQPEEYGLSLVDLVEEVLDREAGLPFLLDGQGIAIEDFLAWRPSRRADLSAALAEGRVEAGPWYVLADNLIPGGEALVRNLREGGKILRDLGAFPPSVLYCPDAFGHPAALPIVGNGFGFAVAIVWRGYGGPRWPDGDAVRWRGGDGSEMLVHHLPPEGYEYGSNLPVDPAAADARWREMRRVLARRASLGVVLVANGADHHAVQRGHERAFRALAAAATPEPVRVTSLAEWGAILRGRGAARRLPVVTGELRDSAGYVWSLQGTFGSRAVLKRRNAAAERLLVRDVEPWSALAGLWRAASDHRRAAPNHRRARADDAGPIWRLLLACHPHDTLCGCSIDEVARAMDVRLSAVAAAGAKLGRRSRLELLGHDAAAARDSEQDWRHVVVVRNRAAYARWGVTEIDVDLPLADVPVGPGSGGRVGVARRPGPFSLGAAGLPTQQLAGERRFAREESPRHYPRNALVERRRVLAWLPPMGGYALSTLAVGAARRPRLAPPSPVTVRAGVLDNGILRVWVSPSDGLCVSTTGGLLRRDLLGFESVGERGDLYTHSPVPGTSSSARLLRSRVAVRGPLRARLDTRWRVDVATRSLRSATGLPVARRAARLELTVRIELDAGAPFVRLRIDGENHASDHRLRVVLRTGVPGDEVWSDAAFGAIRRPPVDAPAHEWEAEHASRTAPLHRYVARFGQDEGMTVVSDGLAEYEATVGGDVAITLVRATGELSRHDLPERPGHAGWPVPTPEAQSLGAFGAELALFPHGPRNEASLCAIERVCDDVLLPLRGESWRSAIEPPPSLEGFALEGEGLAFSSCSRTTDGSGVALRCINLLDRSVDGAWRMAGISEAWLARLDETKLGLLAVNEDRVRFQAGPHAVVTVVVRAG